MSYQLTIDDLQGTDENSASIRAARNSNPAVLEALLNHYFTHLQSVPAGRVDPTLEGWSPNANSMGAIYGTYESPLTAAIRANVPENARALLAAGADPTGITLDDLSDYAVRFIRGRDAKTDMSSFAMCPPRAQILAVAESKGITQQTQPLTRAELDERSKGFPRFWTEPNVPGQRLRLSKALTALEVAAGLGREDLFSMVHDAGADETAWTSASEASRVDFDDTKPSFMSTSSPVHEAIAAGQPAMLHRLLHVYGYSPNYRPLAAPTVALPPLSFALARCDPSNPDVWACITTLLQHEGLDEHLRSPIFDIHPLHFAVARHDVDLLSRLPMALSSAGTTALGQTLLHIASLPMTSKCIDKENPNSVQSIHCARTLNSTWLSHQLPSPLHLAPNRRPGSGINRVNTVPETTPLTTLEREAQLSSLRLLVEAGIDVGAQDVDGNTALHYLATTLNVDPRALQLLGDMEGGEVYNTCKNQAGLTPRALWESGNEA